MTWLLSIFLLAAAAEAPAAAPPATAPSAKQAMGSALGEILQGDGVAARTILQGLPDSDLDAKDRRFRDCTLSRLGGQAPNAADAAPEPTDPFARDLLALYRTYWRDAALSKAPRTAAEQALVAGVAHLLGQPELKDMDAEEPLIAARLKAAGLFALEGQTGVFHDLMIWSRQSQRVEQVELPEGGNATNVSYLDGFISRGWSSYLSCEKTGTGGWTTGDGLFVIVPSYDSLTDENFRVNFLAHESQHYSDKKRFGDLPSWRLEYRAKLVELAYADTTRDRVLDSFGSNQGDDPADPHSYADKRVLAALERRLGLSSAAALHTIPLERLHQAAVAELKADSRKLASSVHRPKAARFSR
jgi:hypothetical protein